jgi:hypothetical protein
MANIQATVHLLYIVTISINITILIYISISYSVIFLIVSCIGLLLFYCATVICLTIHANFSVADLHISYDGIYRMDRFIAIILVDSFLGIGSYAVWLITGLILFWYWDVFS